MDSLKLSSRTVCRKISAKQNLRKQIKQLTPLLPVIDEHKELSVTIVSKEDIIDILKYHKTKKAFETIQP